MVDITGEINDIRILRKGVEGIIKINSINTNLKLPKIRIKFLNNNDLLVGQKIKCRIKIFNIKQNNLSHRSKFFLISYMNKIYARGYLVGPIEEIGINKSFKYYIYILHQNIYQRLIKNLGKQCGNLVAAFLLGEGKAIDNKLLKDLRSAGVSHLICISGLHLSLVSMIFFSSIRFILNMFDCIVYKYNVKIMATSITLISTYAYLLLSGSQIAASRAFILTTIYIFSIMLMRRMSILRGLGLAALILLIDCPAYVFHPSFQLSFTAVLSLLAGFEIPYSNKLKKGHNILYRMRSYIINNIYSSFLAGVVIAPFIIQNFRVFPTYSVLSNLVAVPLMSFCLMPIGLFGVFSMLINAELLPLSLLKVFVNCLINIIVYTNKLPHATYYIGYLPNSIFIIFLMSFFWLCIWKTKIRLLGIIGILIFIISLI